MKRFIVYWSLQDIESLPPWPVCAGHRDAVAAPMLDPAIHEQAAEKASLIVTEVAPGICALAAFGNCCDDPVECIPVLDVNLLNREA
jgi:hypothetical protein